MLVLMLKKKKKKTKLNCYHQNDVLSYQIMLKCVLSMFPKSQEDLLVCAKWNEFMLPFKKLDIQGPSLWGEAYYFFYLQINFIFKTVYLSVPWVFFHHMVGVAMKNSNK